MSDPSAERKPSSPYEHLHDAPIWTARFLLRPLTAQDATPSYLSWFSDPEAHRYIDFATRDDLDLAELRRYIEVRERRPDVLFLGIFERASGAHIGNIKYEPIDMTARHATMGILVGDPDWRGRGVGTEVLEASMQYLAEVHGIEVIDLGVASRNTAAIRAYEKVGFTVDQRLSDRMTDDRTFRMVWRRGG